MAARYYYKYRGIPNDPLTRPEAQSCLYDLVQKLVQVIESFHQNGWAHQDIRLQNICFDEDCMPVFIDLDRCQEASETAYEGKGCMYSMCGSASQTDWLQLGLMVCWVLDTGLGQEEEEEGDYHTRDCKKICESLEDPFLKSLIGKGMWCVVLMLCCGCSYSWPSKHKQLSRLAFWEQDDLSYACLYPQKHFVPPSFVFFAFPLGKFEQVQLNEWCKKSHWMR